MCHSARELTSHCLVECPIARACWDRTGIGVINQVHGTFAEWLETLFQTLDDDQLKIVAMICWALWRVRNDSVWKGKCARVNMVCNLAHSTLVQWTRAQDKFEVPTAAFLTSDDGAEKWIKPTPGVIKINVDAALSTEASTYSFACVARDDQGHFIEAITCCRQGVVSPKMAEAMGVREALSWLKKKYWSHVVIETDCLTVIQSLRSSISMDSYFGGIISDCKQLMEDKNISIVFVKRSANGVAHVVARASLSHADRIIRSVDLTPAIVDVILKDIC
ncbi:uncharacterized protein LOC133825112 [Humulus lupulus]|uniref:uncharacterized protein LOC133825112 n=1 Tax=Humulus lupulus TaxID=3486 RepID=UPI002B417BBC|nr:uncharacterized protein LOC133825112 [Humulus lupulus]